MIQDCCVIPMEAILRSMIAFVPLRRGSIVEIGEPLLVTSWRPVCMAGWPIEEIRYRIDREGD